MVSHAYGRTANVEYIELENGVCLIPNVTECEDGYTVDFLIRRVAGQEGGKT